LASEGFEIETRQRIFSSNAFTSIKTRNYYDNEKLGWRLWARNFSGDSPTFFL